MQTSNPSFQMILKVATALGDLGERTVFVGGAVTSILVTDPGAPMTRATDDVDLVIRVLTTVDYHRFENELREHGFNNDLSSEHIGRFLLKEQKVDVVPVGGDVTGVTNKWYPATVANARGLSVGDLTIRHADGPCFLATKFEAFQSRGRGEYASSSDIEDIIVVTDGRPVIVDEVHESDADLRRYIRKQFNSLTSDTRFLDAVPAHLMPDVASQARQAIVLERIRAMSE